MSSGPYTIVGYQAEYDIDNIHPIRVQPETTELVLTIGGTSIANEGTGLAAINNPISAVVSGGRRVLGLNAAKVRFIWEGAAPAGYDPGGTLTLPLLNSAIRQVGRGATGVYLTFPVIVVGTTPEITN